MLDTVLKSYRLDIYNIDSRKTLGLSYNENLNDMASKRLSFYHLDL